MSNTVKNIKSATTKKGKYISFFLNQEEYAIEIEKVREIIGIMAISTVPNTPNYIRGVLNLREKVIPVIDLRLKFGLQFKEYGGRTSIIIVETFFNGKKALYGTVVDSVSEVMQVGEDDIEETPHFGVNVNTQFILGMAKVKEGVKILLDIDKVLTSDELTILSKMQNNLNETIAV